MFYISFYKSNQFDYQKHYPGAKTLFYLS